MTSPTDIKTAVNQGVYWRDDAKAYMTDTEYYEWMQKNHIVITRNGYRAEVVKARNEHLCSLDCPGCTRILPKRQHYWSITVGGGGLNSIKMPDRVHIKCLKRYWRNKED
jgi:hypothetical protein